MRIYTQDKGMEFGREKCAMLIMKNGKGEMTEGMELPNPGKIRMFGEKGNLQVLGNTGSGHTIKQEEMKEKKKNT